MAVLAIVASTACHANAGKQGSTSATDEWTRSFALSPDGEVSISNRNGRIEVAGGSGSMVDIRAERIVHAATEKSAHELLSRLAISEQATPDRVAVVTEGIPGILIGVSADVIFHVQVPVAARIRAQMSNGDVTVHDVDGGSFLSTTNGRASGANLRGGVEAHAINGKVSLDIASLGTEAVKASITNGSIELGLPADANATLTATTINGQARVLQLPFTPAAEADGERPRGRRTVGHINAGGTAIELRVVNGSVTVHAR